MIRTGETICAPATSGGSAIAVIRISGPGSITICENILSPSDKTIRITDLPGYSIVYGEIESGEEIIDDVLVSIFRAPHSTPAKMLSKFHVMLLLIFSGKYLNY